MDRTVAGSVGGRLVFIQPGGGHTFIMVRIARNREETRMARASLGAAGVLGVLLLAGWMLTRDRPLQQPEQRRLLDYDVLWVCENNASHNFDAPGRYGTLPCRFCAGRCTIQLDYICTVAGHGFNAQVQIERVPSADKEGERWGERIVRYRSSADSPWVDTDGVVPCPHTGCTSPTRRPHLSWSQSTRRRTPPPDDGA